MSEVLLIKVMIVWLILTTITGLVRGYRRRIYRMSIGEALLDGLAVGLFTGIVSLCTAGLLGWGIHFLFTA